MLSHDVSAPLEAVAALAGCTTGLELARAYAKIGVILGACQPRQVEVVCAEGGAVDAIVSALTLDALSGEGGAECLKEFLKTFKPLLKKTGAGSLPMESVINMITLMTKAVQVRTTIINMITLMTKAVQVRTTVL